MKLPNDPIMLMSVLNTYLRDTYANTDEMYSALGLDKEATEAKLAAVGYKYNNEANQYR